MTKRIVFGHPEREERPPQGPCHICPGTGHIQAKLKNTVLIYAFRCSCAAGTASKRKFPQWSHELLKDYELVK